MLNILLFLFVFAVLYLKACLMSGGAGGEIIVLYLGHLGLGPWNEASCVSSAGATLSLIHI